MLDIQDVFKENFLIQWHPESLKTESVAISHPRVYLIDFEFAVAFSAECSAEERVCTGWPTTEGAPDELYTRPVPKEVFAGEPYDPFKLDMWQLGLTLWDFSVRHLISNLV